MGRIEFWARQGRRTAIRKAGQALKAMPAPVAGALKSVARGRVRNLGLISLVIPLHNVETYLSDMLTSVIKQDYPHLEIILVDDGSTDRTVEIAETFAQRDKRISLYATKHLGNGHARNLGVAKATGEYLAFADSDDVVRPGAYRSMIETISATQSDFVVGSYSRLKGSQRISVKVAENLHAEARLRTNLRETPDAIHEVFLWNKLYKKSFWDEQVGLIPESVFYEDQEPALRSLLRARTFDLITTDVYQWRIREDGSSITQQKRSLKQLRDRISVATACSHLLGKEAALPIRKTWFAKLLDVDLFPFFEQAPYGDQIYFDELAAGAAELGSLCEQLTGESASTLSAGVHARVLFTLFSSGDRVNAERVLVSLVNYGRGSRVRFDSNRWTAHPSYVAEVDPLDPTHFEIDPATLRLESNLQLIQDSDGHWHIRGFAFIRGLSDEVPPTVTVALSGPGGQQVLATKAMSDPTIDVQANDADATHELSGFDAVVDAAQLAYAPLEISVTWSRDGLELQSRHTIRAKLPVDTATTPVVTEFLELDAGQGFALVVENVPQGDLSCFALVTAKTTYRPTSVTMLSKGKQRLQFELASELWDRPISAPKSGAYTLREFSESSQPHLGRPVRMAAALRSRGDFQLQKKAAAISLECTTSGATVVRIGPPLSTMERSKYWQSQMRKSHATAPEAPLRQQVLFESFGGTVCTDSPRAISDDLSQRGTALEILWSVADFSVPFPDYARPVIVGSHAWHQALAESAYLVNNNNFPHFFRKRPGQKYLQTWHGTPLKRIGKDVPNHTLSPAYRATLDREAQDWDLLIAQNQYSARIFPAAFGYEGEVICEGYPRNDALAVPSPKTRHDTRRILGLGDDQIAILYAPTWRDNVRGEHGYIFGNTATMEDLLVAIPQNARLLVRGHHNISAGIHNSNADAVDVSNYPEINDLIAASDVLITDYSSLIFDYMVTGKPIIRLVEPEDDYEDAVRGLYFDAALLRAVEATDSGREAVRLGLNRMALASNPYDDAWYIKDDGNSASRIWRRFLGLTEG